MSQIMKMVRYFSVAALASLLAHSVWAATPVAIWDGFTGEDGDLSKNGYTWTKSTNTTIADGVVTIGSDGGLTLTPGNNDIIRTARTLTIVMDVSDIPSDTGVTILHLNVNNSHVSLTCSDATLNQRWNNNTGYGALSNFSRTGTKRIAFTYLGNGKDNEVSGSTTYIDGVRSIHAGNLQTSGGGINQIDIGAYQNASNIAAGMKIHNLALFDYKLSDSEVRSFDMAMPTMISNVDKGLTGSSNAAAKLEKLRMIPQTDLPEGTNVRIKSLAIGKRSNSADIPSYLVLNGYKSGTAVNTTVNGVAMSRWDFAGEVVLTMGQDYELKGYNASGVESQCGYGLYTNCTDDNYKAVWCDWFKSPNVGKDYAPRYAIEVEVSDTPMPRGWVKVDGNFDNFGSVSVGWKDTATSFEDSPNGQACYTGATGKYPYYENMDWGNATSFSLVGNFKVAVADGQTSPSGLFGIGWASDGLMLAATANKVSLVWTGSHVTGTSPIESDTLGIDLTAGYHSYALVADASASTVKVYVDGEEVISCEETTISLASSNWTNNNQKRGGVLSLPGGEMSGTKRNTDTRCDEYRIYGVALTADQVASLADKPTKLADDLIWLPIGDSITEGEKFMGHPGEGDVDTRGGYRYQLWKAMEDAGQRTVSVGYRTGHSGTVEDPTSCRWAWHAAQYGGVIMHDNYGTHGAAGLNVETTLEVAGYPDVITVLLGVNDCSFTSGSDEQVAKVFETWVNMITKLSALRPKSTICVSTLLPAAPQYGNYIPKFNANVRAAATAGEAPFNCANVVFADMNQEAFNGEYTAGYHKSTDGLHPNETGSVILANAFSEYLKAAVVDRATHAAELVSVDNGTAGYVTVRFNKALKSVTSATLTITGTDVAGESVSLTLTNGTIDETNKRLLKFATSEALKGGTYTATITNLSGTDGNGIALPATLSIDDSKFVEILGTGAAANVPASLLTGFVKHGTLAMSDGTVGENGIGSGDNFSGNGPDEQFTTANELPQYVKRVGYYMELKRPGQPAQFVWTSMDASTGFGSRSEKIGIPTTSSGNVKALVNNLQVYGNRGNFSNSIIGEDGTSSDVGIVEFTPYDWAATDQSGYPQDFNAGKFGWNDMLGSSTLKGGMQIAKVLRTSDFDNYTKPGAEMLFAYNNFNRAITTDIGIGSFTTHRNNAGGGATTVYDWTDLVSGTGMKVFAANAYEVKKLEIWTEKGETPAELYIAAGETVTKSASDPLTLPVRGEGRLILENYLPTGSDVLASLQNSATWTGTVEIKNYTKPTGDNFGIIYFQDYANANSTIALNGVTSTMFTNGSNHPDQTFGSLEIMEGGWASHAGDFTVSPLYNCNLKGSGAITINHRTKSGTVYFCGNHSDFSGSINFAADADKGVVLAPAGNARTTTGPAARQILIHANTTVRIAGTVNGMVKLAARNSVSFFDVNAYGNAETTVELMGIGSGYVTAGNPTSSPKIVLSGNVAFTDGFTDKSTTWTEVSGTGNFSVSKGSNGNQNYVISTLKGYTGAITAKGNTTLTIGSVVTTLTAIPATATTVVTFGTDCKDDKVLIPNLTICLADGTDITDQVVITKAVAGISIEKAAAKIGEKLYATLQAAADAAVNGDTIELVDEVEASGLSVSGKAVILEHNGKITDVDPLKGTSIAPAINAECTAKLGNWANAVIIGDFEKCVALTANKVDEDGDPILNQGAIKDKYPFGSYLSFFVGKSITLQDDVLLPAYAKTAAGVYFCSNTTTEDDGLVLELNGHEIRQTFADNGNGYTGHAAVNVNSGYLTIQDSSEAGNGKIIGSTNGLGVQDYVIEGVPASHATLKNGTIISQGGAPNGASNCGFVVAAYGHSTFVMDGGTLQADASENGSMYAMVNTAAKKDTDEPYATFIMNGGTIEAAPTSMTASYSVLACGESTITGGIINGVSYFYDVTEITGGFVNQIFSAWKISISGTAQIGWLDVMEYEGYDTTSISGGMFAANVVRVYDKDYAKIRQDTLLPYVVEGYEVVQGEDKWYYVQKIVNPIENELDITISPNGETITPNVTGDGDFIIVDDPEEVSTSDHETIPLETGLYYVKMRDAEKTVQSTLPVGVVNAKPEATAAKKTIAVAVPFDDATVANLLNTALMSKGDELKAVDQTTQTYQAWTLGADKKWTPMNVMREGGMNPSPAAEKTTLMRGTAVWVTSAAKVVALGKYENKGGIIAPSAPATTYLLANPTMGEFIVPVTETAKDQVVSIGSEYPTRYTVVDQNGTKAWKCSKSVPATIPGLSISGSSEVISDEKPVIPVGKGYWMIKK